MLNAQVHPRVPSQGSVGASGDLAPLAHLALAMMGEGADGAALRASGLRPITLEAKEGLAFVNGTQAQTGMAALLVHDAWVLWRTAHAAAAMSLEAVRGTPDPFDARIHDARPHPLQQRSAALLRELLADSEIRESHRENDPRVQDAYSLRCTPQVLGAVGEALAFAERLVTVELNAATDNPLVFGRDVLSGGNFHGQPIALALDVLGIGLTTLAGLAERRLERIVNPDLSAGLPAFLAREPGVESGFMTAQIAAAALVADCRVLATPASVQSVPTEGNQEDVVPMGMSAAWKAALRMLMNNLDPEVAERPQDLVVYGGTGKAARDWPSFDAICRTLVALEDDETLLVQSGKPVGVFQTHPEAPRVLIANANLVGRWARWEVFRDLERRGLIMFGQMTAGSWIYIGTQGILQGTYETFGAVARRHFGGSRRGRLVLTGGLGGMGGAQPLAATMHGGVCLAVEVDPARVQRRRDTRYLDRSTASLDEALRCCEAARRDGEALSVGLVGNCAEVLPELARRRFVPDVLTDQTSAHDPLNGYVPAGCSLEQAAALRHAEPAEYVRRATASIVTHVRAMLEMKRQGAVTFDYGNNIRTQAAAAGLEQAFEIPGFVPEYIRPLFCEGRGPFRWVALSGEARDLQRTDRLALELFPENDHLRRWIALAQARVAFQGLPARICWLGQGERARFGCALNDLVQRGELAAPIVIGRDHLDTGSVASPFRETEGMRDGSDAIADWPILNALLNTASGAAWVSFHHGGGTGIGNSLHAGQVSVAAVLVEGTRIAAGGTYRELRAAHRGAELAEVHGVLYPGLIDCHTHAVFGAPRLDDHERRALGEDYKAIAARGGGILQSVADVRARPLAELVVLTRARVATLLAHGSTTIEVKSGYGLELEAELKQLRVIREVAASVPVTLVATFLGAHEVPPEFRARRAGSGRPVCEA